MPTSNSSGEQHLGITATPSTGFSRTNRRESFLYRTDPFDNVCNIQSNLQPASRASSITSSDPLHLGEDIAIVTPFAQLLASLWSVRTNIIAITNLPLDEKIAPRGKRVSFILNSQPLSDEVMQCARETVEELDWCLGQLEIIKTHRSVTEMASDKFRKLLNRELNQFAISSKSGSQVSKYLLNTYVCGEPKDSEAWDPGSHMFDSSPLEDTPSIASTSQHNSIFTRAKHAVANIGGVKRLRGFVQSTLPDYGVNCQKEIGVYMQRINDWGVNIFKIHDLSRNHSLVTVTYSLLKRRGLIRLFNIPPNILVNYLFHIENHYRMNLYHNSIHAADVVQSINVLLNSPTLEGSFSDLEIFAALIAAAIHDVDHPGLSNQFLINTNDELALLYNDTSVLEQHHLAVAFKLLQCHNCDFLTGLNKQKRQQFRKIVIAMVLATDMNKHMSLLADLKTMVESKKVSESNSDSERCFDSHNDRMQILQTMIHLADLSNPTKPIELYRNWNRRIMEEYWRQGDKERQYNIEISPMCDRNLITIEKSQIGFIDYIVHPIFETWSDLVFPDANPILDQLEENRMWYIKKLGSEEPLDGKELKNQGQKERTSEEFSSLSSEIYTKRQQSDGSFSLKDANKHLQNNPRNQIEKSN